MKKSVVDEWALCFQYNFITNDRDENGKLSTTITSGDSKMTDNLRKELIKITQTQLKECHVIKKRVQEN